MYVYDPFSPSAVFVPSLPASSANGQAVSSPALENVFIGQNRAAVLEGAEAESFQTEENLRLEEDSSSQGDSSPLYKWLAALSGLMAVGIAGLFFKKNRPESDVDGSEEVTIID